MNIGIDAIGVLLTVNPKGFGLARTIGHQAGYVGVVADQAGAKLIGSIGTTAGASNGLKNLSDASKLGVTSSVLTFTGLVPGVVGEVSSWLSLGVDGFKLEEAIRSCY